jgi:hypothetical protein
LAARAHLERLRAAAGPPDHGGGGWMSLAADLR